MTVATRSYGRLGNGVAPVTDGLWILLLCAALGLVARNYLIAGGALTLVLLRVGQLHAVVRWLNRHALTTGVFLLVLGLLTPIAGERLSLRAFASELTRPSGWIGAAVAAAAAFLGRHGLDYLRLYPAALVGLLVGSVVGTILLGGVPTGPLIAAGTTALVLRLLGVR